MMDTIRENPDIDKFYHIIRAAQAYHSVKDFKKAGVKAANAADLIRGLDPFVDNSRRRSAYKYVMAASENDFWPRVYSSPEQLDHLVYCGTCGHSLKVNQKVHQMRHRKIHLRDKV